MIKGINELASTHGISLFGIANLEKNPWGFKRESYFKNYIRGISLGLPLLKGMYDGLVYHSDLKYLKAFEYHSLNQINICLDIAAVHISMYLEHEGYKAYIIPGRSSKFTSSSDVFLSHKTIANLAGLGTIGKNSLLVNSQYGPRFRLISILTDAPLEANIHSIYRSSWCDNCDLCIKACPVRAIKGESFDLKNPLFELVDYKKCENYRSKRDSSMGTRVCNLCIQACPVGAGSPG